MLLNKDNRVVKNYLIHLIIGVKLFIINKHSSDWKKLHPNQNGCKIIRVNFELCSSDNINQ